MEWHNFLVVSFEVSELEYVQVNGRLFFDPFDRQEVKRFLQLIVIEIELSYLAIDL